MRSIFSLKSTINPIFSPILAELIRKIGRECRHLSNGKKNVCVTGNSECRRWRMLSEEYIEFIRIHLFGIDSLFFCRLCHSIPFRCDRLSLCIELNATFFDGKCLQHFERGNVIIAFSLQTLTSVYIWIEDIENSKRHPCFSTVWVRIDRCCWVLLLCSIFLSVVSAFFSIYGCGHFHSMSKSNANANVNDEYHDDYDKIVDPKKNRVYQSIFYACIYTNLIGISRIFSFIL